MLETPVKIWYYNMHFKHNPFSIKPSLYTDKLTGQQDAIDMVSTCIEEGKIVCLSGPFGAGKTTILKSIIGQFAGARKVIYFSCNRVMESLDVDKLLHERFGSFGKLFGIKSKNMILFLDEADALSQDDIDRLMTYHKKKHFKAIVLVHSSDTTLNVAGRHKVEKIEIKTVEKEDAVCLARKRIGNTDFISDKVFEKIFDRSNSPRSFLKNCEDVCRYAYKMERKKVLVRDIAKALA